jgi:hypothetical protein
VGGLLVAGCSVTNKQHCGNLDGDATCAARGGTTPRCSLCVGENDGCVAGPVEAMCAAGPAGPSGAPTSSEGPTTSGTTGHGPTSSESTATTSGDSSSGSDETGAVCGDDRAEGQEACDGADLKGYDCKASNPVKYNGGTLQCGADCSYFDDSLCCLASGQSCGMQVVNPCCPGLECELSGLELWTCQ